MGELKRGIARSLLKDYQIRKERHDKAQGLVDEGKLFQAAQLFRENLAWSFKNFGQDHETTIYDQETLAYTLNELGHSNLLKNRTKSEDSKLRFNEFFEEARNLDAAALETRTRVQGTSPPSKDLLETQRNLANDYASLGDFKKATSLFLENYEARRKHPELGEDDEFTLRTGHDLAGCWHEQKQYRKAKSLNEKILEARIRLKRPEAEIAKSRNALNWNLLMIQEKSTGKSDTGIRSSDGRGGSSAKNDNVKSPEVGRKKAIENKPKDATNGKSVEKKEEKGGKTSEDTIWESAAASKGNGKSKGNEKLKGTDKEGVEEPKPSNPVTIPNIIFKYVDPRASGISLPGSNNASVYSGSSGSSPSRRGPGRPITPNIVNDNPGQQRSKPRAKSPELIQSNASSSENLKPTDNNTRRNTGPNRARSLSNHKNKDKPKPPARARSSSPPTADRQYYRQLSDAGPGKDDENSAREVGKWFHSLQTETQALLEPLRRTRGKRVKIAILDTGIDIGHPYFAADQAQQPNRRRIKSWENFLNEGGDAQDVCGHGTHSIGILRKIAPEADIYVARVAENFDHDIDPKAVEKAIYRACRDKKDEKGVKNWNVDIITMSFGFYGRSIEVQKAIQEALSKPVLVFAAASNNGTMKEVTFPAWLGGVICVNSATANGTPSSFNPDAKAPRNFSILGEDVKSAWIRSPGDLNAERVMSGTSVATPIAAAVAALVLEFVLQSEAESVLLEQLEDLKHQDGMPEVFAKMVRSEKEYRNIVPWALLSATQGTAMVSNRIEHALRRFRGV